LIENAMGDPGGLILPEGKPLLSWGLRGFAVRVGGLADFVF
jgi:hypothetical protein